MMIWLNVKFNNLNGSHQSWWIPSFNRSSFFCVGMNISKLGTWTSSCPTNLKTIPGYLGGYRDTYFWDTPKTSKQSSLQFWMVFFIPQNRVILRAFVPVTTRSLFGIGHSNLNLHFPLAFWVVDTPKLFGHSRVSHHKSSNVNLSIFEENGRSPGGSHHRFHWNGTDLSHSQHGKLTWNTKMEVWKMRFLFNKLILRFHVNFPKWTSQHCHEISWLIHSLLPS